MISITFMAPADVINVLTRFGEKNGKKRSDVIRDALIAYSRTIDQKICPDCGTVNESSANFCFKCGKEFTIDAEIVIKMWEEIKNQHPEEYKKAKEQGLIP